MRSVCVYCGSNSGNDPAFGEATRALANLLVARGIRIIYGGAALGLMGLLADTAMKAGGEVVGVLPQGLKDREIGHPGLTELHLVASMHERKAMMAELSEGFIALPGGIGTLEELIEIYTWGQLGLHRKPLGMLNVNGYYDALGAFLDHAVDSGFLHPQQRAVMRMEADPERLLEALGEPVPEPAVKWLDPQ